MHKLAHGPLAPGTIVQWTAGSEIPSTIGMVSRPIRSGSTRSSNPGAEGPLSWINDPFISASCLGRSLTMDHGAQRLIRGLLEPGELDVGSA